MKDTFTLWAHQDKKSNKLTWVACPEYSRADVRASNLPSERVVKLECRIVQPQRKPKRGKYPNDNFGLPSGYTPHNPDKLTREQVGEGFRLLAKPEIGLLEFSFDINAWIRKSWNSNGWLGSQLDVTYRVPINTQIDINPELKTK